jgi:acylaminoacyl-peptidase
LQKLSSKEGNARYPKITPDQKTLIYLSNTVGGPHAGCSTLKRYDIATEKVSTIVDVVYKTKKHTEFQGIYSYDIVDKCFTQYDNTTLIFLTTAWRSQTVIISIDIESGGVIRVSPSNTLDSWTLFSVTLDGWIIASRSNIKCVGALMICKFNQTLSSQIWIEIDSYSFPTLVSEKLSSSEISISEIPGRSSNLEVIFIKPGLPSSPLIVMPHGGPHGSFTTSFSLTIAAYIELGFSCLLVNYTGSIGFGDDSINELVGKIGSLDVTDVHAAALWASLQPGIDCKNIFLYGGSHGGFLTGEC